MCPTPFSCFFFFPCPFLSGIRIVFQSSPRRLRSRIFQTLTRRRYEETQDMTSFDPSLVEHAIAHHTTCTFRSILFIASLLSLSLLSSTLCRPILRWDSLFTSFARSAHHTTNKSQHTQMMTAVHAPRIIVAQPSLSLLFCLFVFLVSVAHQASCRCRHLRLREQHTPAGRSAAVTDLLRVQRCQKKQKRQAHTHMHATRILVG